MRYPNFDEEKKLWRQGYEFVVGLDEAGRGPLAGPVVAAAVMINRSIGDRKHFNIPWNVKMFSKMKDAKKISEKKRNFFYSKLTNHKYIKWGIGIVSEKVIDKINIFNAAKLAMKRAFLNISCKYDGHSKFKSESFLLIDGNFLLNGLDICQKSIIAADEKVFSCMAAGIIAKVQRDKIMKNLHNKYPEYGFDLHKGYGTKLHIKNLKNFGPCKIHRKSFSPVNSLVKKEFI